MLYFPHPLLANDEGLLAVGADLNPERLLLAYTFGIFPWYNNKPILWWYTAPRCVLHLDQLKVSKSMRSLVYRKRPWKVTIDNAFEEVLDHCSEIGRPGQDGTWITNDIKAAYLGLHQMNVAHSVEVWDETGQLVGGLYGLIRGNMFCGESMFAKESNTSKYAFIHLVTFLQSIGCTLIDCQQDTPHLRSLGATLIDKMEFWQFLKNNSLNDDLEINSIAFKEWCQDEYGSSRQ